MSTLTPKDHLKRLENQLINEINKRKASSLNQYSAHGDRYKKGFLDCLQWNLELIRFEIKFIEENKSTNSGGL